MADITDDEKRLEQLLPVLSASLRAAFADAVRSIHDANTLDETERLIETGAVEEAIVVAAAASSSKLADEYARAFFRSGGNTARFLEESLRVVIGFDVVNERAVEALRNARLRLIQGFTEEQREITRNVLVDGASRGLNPRGTARNLLSDLGLTVKQQKAVMRYRELLEAGSSEALRRQLRDRRFDSTVERAVRSDEPLSPEQIDRMVGRYRERMLRHRAEVIGRTESLRAVHAGNHEAYVQAVERGALFLEDLERTWVDSHDSRVRSSHRRLNGVTRGLNETFPADDGPLRYPGDPDGPASEVVQCRCVLTTRIRTI